MSRYKSFFYGAGMLAFCTVVSKILGACFRIPLTNILGAEGMGIYQMVFPLYTVLLTLSSGGLPVAISRVVASLKTQQENTLSKKVLWTTICAMSVLSGGIMLLVICFNTVLARWQGNSLASIAYLGIAPAIVIVGLIGAFKGYFQGRQNMLPSSISQLIEQSTKLVVGISLSTLFLQYGIQYAVLGAVLGITLSEGIALLILLVFYFLEKLKNKSVVQTEQIENTAHANQQQYAEVFEQNNLTKTPPLSSNESNQLVDIAQSVSVQSKKKSCKNKKQKLSASNINASKQGMQFESAYDWNIDEYQYFDNLEYEKQSNDFDSKVNNQEQNTKNNSLYNKEVGHEENKNSNENNNANIKENGKENNTEKSKKLDLIADNASTKSILFAIYKVALPVSIGALILPLIQVFDSIVVINFLISQGATRGIATSQYGILNGPVSSLINLPVVMTMSISIALLPRVASCVANNDSEQIQSVTTSSMRHALLLSIPASVGMMVFAKEIIVLLYGRGLTDMQLTQATKILQLSAITILYASILQICTATLQGHNKASRPAYILGIGAVLKLLVTLVLMQYYGIFGVAISTVVLYIVAATINLFVCKKYLDTKALYTVLPKIILATIISIAVGLGIKNTLVQILPNIVTLALCAFGTILVYLALCIALKCIHKNEWKIFGKIKN